ncbi:MAG: hypothetical protein ACI4XH_01160 [Acutalibacteraceae bacterium]
MEKLYLILIIVFALTALISLLFSLKTKSKSPGVICALSGLLVIVFAVLSLFNFSTDSSTANQKKYYVTVTKFESTSAKNYSERKVKTSGASDDSKEQPSAAESETTAGKSNTNQNLQKIVYITKTGKKYHYTYPCGNGTFYECSLEEAISKGLEPCKRCVTK